MNTSFELEVVFDHLWGGYCWTRGGRISSEARWRLIPLDGD